MCRLEWPLVGCIPHSSWAPGSAAGEEALAQRIADNAKLTHEKRIIKKFRNMTANSFALGTRGGFLLENVYLSIETCRERESELKKLKSPLISLEVLFSKCCSVVLKLFS